MVNSLEVFRRSVPRKSAGPFGVVVSPRFTDTRLNASDARSKAEAVFQMVSTNGRKQ